MKPIFAAVLGTVVALVAVIVLIPLLVLGGNAQASCLPGTQPSSQKPTSGTASATATTSTNTPRPFGQWNSAQVTQAGRIVAAGREQKIPARGWVIAVATAMQESRLRNLANATVPASLTLPHEDVAIDHDSVGLFQQRPLPPDGAGAWGTVEELMTPRIAASKFYAALLKVDGWQTMALHDAAQAVQKSCCPTAYADWEDDAERLIAYVLGLPNLDSIGGGAPEEPCGTGSLAGAPVGPQGWVKPINADPGSPFGPRGGTLHAGVDLSTTRGTPIYAASAGTVVYADCDPGTGGCDVDGSPQTPGCGWYVDMWHPGNIVTRYCHFLKRPEVRAGQNVKAGQIIGFEGTSGNSSGPHLHFEIHLNVPRGRFAGNDTAIDPVPWMRSRGAALQHDNAG